ncbi:hypothetical protein GCM10007111_29030 [Virgibacillus kapii]|uniref:Uncharacterized protein n=1 Tax=Virgibacillus kapii TaxID=1638645 RepID=A0ABQ2DN92_9BACI|nr:hypothetical protein M948_10705 [Virgibacillus sp. CM-4]GGJ65390.1 hypothetical protein GCM10007111_29030 [Virgibacillus kapii]
MKFPIGGDEAIGFLVRDPCGNMPSGGSGATPEPTVKVWMGEGILIVQHAS